MKKILLFAALLLVYYSLFSQDYDITFAANDETHLVDSVHVLDLSRNTELMVPGNATLHLIPFVTEIITEIYSNDLRVYPNPMSKSTCIEFNLEHESFVNIDVIDIGGKVVCRSNCNSKVGQLSYMISDLCAGVYNICITTDLWKQSLKLVSTGESNGNPDIKYLGIEPVYTHLKTSKSDDELYEMEYIDGEILLFTVYAETEITVITLIPTESQCLLTDFVECIDPNGNNYAIVQIGEKIWMAENLKYLPAVYSSDYNSNYTPYYYVYDYNGVVLDEALSTINYETYGVLYNWSAAMNGANTSNTDPSNVQGICPDGWHLPSQLEYEYLRDYLYANSEFWCADNEGSVAKSLASTWGWNVAYYNCAVGNVISDNNSSGFSGEAGGRRLNSSIFDLMGESGLWWTSTNYNSIYARGLQLDYQQNSIFLNLQQSTDNGLSVRCVADAQPPTILTSEISNITHTSATSGGILTQTGGAPITSKGVVWSTFPNPTVENNQGITNNGTEMGVFVSQLPYINVGTTYYVRAYASNTVDTAYGDEIIFSTIDPLTFTNCGDSIAYQGHYYPTVQIGEQCWFAENLRYDNGCSSNYFNYVEDVGYCGYYDGIETNGLLYQWSAIQNICPVGWMLPSHNQWTTLERALCESDNCADKFPYNNYRTGWTGTNEGSKLASDNNVWNTGAITNNTDFGTSGFNALPGCQRFSHYESQEMTDIGEDASWWTSSLATDTSKIWCRYLNYENSGIQRSFVGKPTAMYVRCVQDENYIASLADISISDISEVTQTGAMITCNIDNSGGPEVISRGIVWSSSMEPSIDNNEGILYNGSGIGEYICEIDGLFVETEYAVKAFALNDVGVAYSTTVNVQTIPYPTMPIVETVSVNDIIQTTASCLINILNDGGDSIIYRGVIWGFGVDISLDNNEGVISMESNLSSYELSMTDLNPGFTYYVRAFATNSQGTAYGNLLNFTTGEFEDCGTINYQGYNYNTIVIGDDCWMAENIRFLPQVNSSESISVSEPRYYVFGYDGNDLTEALSSENYSTFGVLYNRVAANQVCPPGWDLPTNSDWLNLERTVCSSADCENQFPDATTSQGWFGTTEGSKLASDSEYWQDGDLDKSSTFGMSGLGVRPGGNKIADDFLGLGNLGGFWTSTNYGNYYSIGRSVYSQNKKVYHERYSNSNALSVRCILGDYDFNADVASVSTIEITSINHNSATSGGALIDDGGSAILAKGIVWSTTPDPSISENIGITNQGIGFGDFISEITNLIPSTTYYVKAYAINNSPGQVSYGQELVFTTDDISIPSLVTTDASNISLFSIQTGGNITNNGGAEITQRGVVYGTVINPTLADCAGFTENGSVDGAFVSQMDWMNCNTTYFIRAYAVNAIGIGYGNQIIVSTEAVPSCNNVNYDGYEYNVIQIGCQCWFSENLRYLPSVTGPEIGSNTEPRYYVSGYTGTSVVDAKSTANYGNYGVLYNWKAAQNACPTGWRLSTDDDWKRLEIGQGIDTGDVNQVGWRGTNEGSKLSGAEALWLGDPTSPLLSNIEFGLSGFDATPGGIRSSFGNFLFGPGYEGMWWGSNYDVNYAWGRYLSDDYTGISRSNYNKTQGFSVRCVKGDPMQTPNVSTGEVQNITQISVLASGIVVTDGGLFVEERGIVWSTEINPTIDINQGRIVLGDGIGSFNCQIDNLDFGTEYIVRAYAINSLGVSYGNNVLFSTLEQASLPQVSTNEIINVLQTSAVLSGSLLDDGGETLTICGFVWSSNPSPTIEENDGIVSDYSNLGGFTDTISPLYQSATYYVRAFALNTGGVSYGNELSFETEDFYSCGELIVDGHSHKTVLIGEQCWMAENLRYLPFVNSISSNSYNSPMYYVYNYNGYTLSYAVNLPNYHTYGSLLNYEAAITACPLGWHLPSSNECQLLIDYLGGNVVAGGKLKQLGVELWNNPNTGASNESGFNALPGGASAPSSSQKMLGQWWSSDEAATAFRLVYNSASMYSIDINTNIGCSVRCLRDVDFQTTTPSIQIMDVIDIAPTFVRLNYHITDTGGLSILENGLVWSNESNPTIENCVGFSSESVDSLNIISKALPLQPQTDYYIAAYARNSSGTTYSDYVLITTPDFNHCGTVDYMGYVYNTIQIGDKCWLSENLRYLPQVNNNSSLTEPKFYVYGYNGSDVEEAKATESYSDYGVLYNWAAAMNGDAAANPDTSFVRGICPEGWCLPSYRELYFFRNYLGGNENMAGAKLKAPSLWCDDDGIFANNETGFSALPGGRYNGSAFVDQDQNGYWWTITEQLPDYAKYYNLECSNGDFNAQDPGIYEYNGFSVRCKRLSTFGADIPEIETLEVSDISQTIAKSGIVIVNNGGANILSQGIVWSTSSLPTINNNLGMISNAGGNSEAICQMSDLEFNTEYFVRAFAENSEGVAYGNEISFQTHPQAAIPVIETRVVTSINSTYAFSGGSLINDGGEPETSYGIVIDTLSMPTLATCLRFTNDGQGIGEFVSILEQLTPLINYYIRAYASNTGGTSYGQEYTFQTTGFEDCGHIDYQGYQYRTIMIGGKCWFAENLRYLPSVYSANVFNPDYPVCYVYGYSGTSVEDAMETENYNIYGALYNYPAAMELCPTGWHLPTYQEWKELEIAVGVPPYQALALESPIGSNEASKLAGNRGLWTDDVLKNNNQFGETGMNFLPGGYTHYYQIYYINEMASVWNAGYSSGGTQVVYWVNIISPSTQVYHYHSTSLASPEPGRSVRCIRD